MRVHPTAAGIPVLLLSVVAFCVTGEAKAQRSPVEVGDSLYARYKNEEAMAAYDRAVRQDSTYLAMYRRAVAANDAAQDLQAANRPDEAEDMFEQAVGYAEDLREAYPDSAGSWFLLAATTGNMAQFAGGKRKVKIGRQVEDYYHKALDIDSTYALAYLVGGIFSREVAQLNWLQRLAANTLFGGIPDASLEDSRRMLERAIRLDSTLFMAHWELAQTLEAMGKPDQAKSHLRFLTVLAPRNSVEARIRSRVREELNADRTPSDG